MINFILNFIIIFILVYLFYLLFVILRKDKINKFKENTFVKYLEKVYKINTKKINVKTLANIVGITNAFIIALTYSVVMLVNNFIYQMLLAIALFILLQLIIYHIIGIYLKRRDK